MSQKTVFFVRLLITVHISRYSETIFTTVECSDVLLIRNNLEIKPRSVGGLQQFPEKYLSLTRVKIALLLGYEKPLQTSHTTVHCSAFASTEFLSDICQIRREVFANDRPSGPGALQLRCQWTCGLILSPSLGP